MTDSEKGVLAGVTLLVVVVLLGILTDWGAMNDPVRVPIREMVKPSRPPHPASIYTPPGWERSP